MYREPPFEPHREPVDHLLARLASSRHGLTAADAAERLRHEGPNLLTAQARVSVPGRLLRHLTHRFALLLWAGAALAFVGERFNPGGGMIFIAVALVVVVLINGAFGVWQETRAERAMAAFGRMLSPQARVLRDGVELRIEARDVVVGDIVLLAEGERVPADGRLLEVHGLRVDHSPLTGECEPQLRSLAAGGAVRRLDSRNLVFSGTLVRAGSGVALTYATGDGTEIGHVAGMVRETRRVESPIRREVHHFTRLVTLIALGLGLVFFATGWLLGNPFWTNLVFAIGIIVANVPEGLLPTVTLGLAIAGRRMARRNALLRTLESAETLGAVTVICTDKTGTLTRNEMRVSALQLDLELPAIEPGAPIPAAAEAAVQVMVLCNNAVLGGGAGGPHGDPTELALLWFADEQAPGASARLRAACERVHERPFDSSAREMVTVHRTPRGLEVLLKGAPEVVIPRCEAVHAGGRLIAMTGELAGRAIDAAGRRARSGERVLALARKSLAPGTDPDEAATGGGYQLVGIVAMHDPPRPEVAGAVRRCRQAGIRTIVISGDHPLTVEAIARQVGIVDGPAAQVYTGDDLARMSQAALRRALAGDGTLFARTSPLDKLRIVTALQEMGQVVAVTGDGVNDAPSLKRADIGVAMGVSGTEVAREAADMVLMDDNFATIVVAVEEGRVIYGNIRRFIGYVLTSNVPEILPYIAFVLLGIPLPLPVLLVLVIDLGTDMAPAIALATEPAEDDVMQQPPRTHSERLLSRPVLLSAYLLWGVLEAAAGFAAYAWVLVDGGWRYGEPLAAGDPLYGRAIAAFFLAVVTCQVASVMVWRTTRQSLFTKGLLRNRAVLVGIGVELILAWLVIYTEVGQLTFATAALPASAWLLPIPFALAMLGLAELIKAGGRAVRAPRRAGPPAHAT